ncbi:MAG: HAD-IA family hydrolase [marine benthic group bacterium]|nr:HAD-IA family hydrolase [Gemmatimonadota bacterium]
MGSKCPVLTDRATGESTPNFDFQWEVDTAGSPTSAPGPVLIACRAVAVRSILAHEERHGNASRKERQGVKENGAGPPAMAVIWDFDGTLVDSHPRNLSVNRAIIEKLTDRSHRSYPALASLSAYEEAVARAGNWRDFYAREFGLGADQVERAGALWPQLQLVDITPQRPFEGIVDALRELEDLPHGIVSQNDSVVIRRALERSGLVSRFASILGYGELPRQDQKPAGGGLLQCIESLGVASGGRVFFVGDHVTDAMAAVDARTRLRERGESTEIVSIAAQYGASGLNDWAVPADHVARSPGDVVELVRNGRQPAASDRCP